MLLQLSDLCLQNSAQYCVLNQRTDSCASLGRSYELRCALPPYCTPSEATLGFCRTGKSYMLYIRPYVTYTGRSEALNELFSSGMRSFPSFAALTEKMRQWGQAIIGGDSAQESLPLLCQQLRSGLEQQVIGQPQATGTAAYRIYTHLSKTQPARPLSLILHGPTGTGKSELGKCVPNVLNALLPASPYHFVWTDLNSYTEGHSVARLVGAPPGYIGYDDRPIFEIVRQHPRTIFLFDELEKAHSEVLKVFMSILDEGRCTSRREEREGGRELDFRRCIFLFTTNLDLSSSPRTPIGFAPPCSDAKTAVTSLSPSQQMLHRDDLARKAMVRSGVLREIAGRFTGFLPFFPLEYSDMVAITAKQISTLGQEFGLRIVSIAPELLISLTPKNVFSVRSTAAALEGVLTPLFSCHVGAGSVHLSGTEDRLYLRTVRSTAVAK